MEADVTHLVGAEHGANAPPSGLRIETATGHAAGTPAPASSRCRSEAQARQLVPEHPRGKSEQALLNVVQQAYICGGLNAQGRPVGRVARPHDLAFGGLTDRHGPRRTGAGVSDSPLGGRYPYLWLNAKIEKAGDGGRVRRKALVVVHGVHETGRREVLALDVREAETGAFWREFLRDLVRRGVQTTDATWRLSVVRGHRVVELRQSLPRGRGSGHNPPISPGVLAQLRCDHPGCVQVTRRSCPANYHRLGTLLRPSLGLANSPVESPEEGAAACRSSTSPTRREP